MVVYEDQIYAYFVKEKRYAEEQLEAEQGYIPYLTASQSPANTASDKKLVEFWDYLLTDFSEGQVPVPDFLEDSDPSFCGVITADEGRYILQPEETVITDLRGMKFLYSLFLDGLKVIESDPNYNEISKGGRGPLAGNSVDDTPDKWTDETVEALYATKSRKIPSFSLYVGLYQDKEVLCKGCQVNEFNIEFAGEGKITPAMSMYAHRDVLRPLKNESNFRSTTNHIKAYDLVDIEWREYNANALPDEGWESLACEIKTANINYNNNIEEDTGFSFCTGNFANNYLAAKTKEITAENTVNQTDSEWREIFYGGKGYVQYERLNYYSIRYTIQTEDGRILKIIYPKARINLETGSQDEQPEETITFNSYNGNFNFGDETIISNYIAWFDNTNPSTGFGNIDIQMDAEIDYPFYVEIKRDVGDKNQFAIIETVRPDIPWKTILEAGDYKAWIRPYDSTGTWGYADIKRANPDYNADPQAGVGTYENVDPDLEFTLEAGEKYTIYIDEDGNVSTEVVEVLKDLNINTYGWDGLDDTDSNSDGIYDSATEITGVDLELYPEGTNESNYQDETPIDSTTSTYSVGKFLGVGAGNYVIRATKTGYVSKFIDLVVSATEPVDDEVNLVLKEE